MKMGTIEYKGYHAAIELAPDLDMFMGKVLNANDIITFYGKSVDDLKREMKVSIEDYLAICKERGRKPAKKYSGKFLVRVNPSTHQMLALLAAKRDVSLNALVEDLLSHDVQEMAS
jgi:predicted HicB family RNase H-like nuclease